MVNFDDAKKENINEHNRNSPQIPDHSQRILIIGVLNQKKYFAI